MTPHKGTELNNVSETWNRNERMRQEGEEGRMENDPVGTAGVSRDLAETIREEAADYDRANKEERVLDGDRATVNDDAAGEE
jgi:hypothetical protein